MQNTTKTYKNIFGIEPFRYGEKIDCKNIGKTLLTALFRARRAYINRLEHTKNGTIGNYLREVITSLTMLTFGIDGKYHYDNDYSALYYGLDKIRHAHDVDDKIMQAYYALSHFDGKTYNEEIARIVTRCIDKLVDSAVLEIIYTKSEDERENDEDERENDEDEREIESAHIFNAKTDYPSYTFTPDDTELINYLIKTSYNSLSRKMRDIIDSLENAIDKNIIALYADGFSYRAICEALDITYGKTQRVITAFKKIAKTQYI